MAATLPKVAVGKLVVNFMTWWLGLVVNRARQELHKSFAALADQLGSDRSTMCVLARTPAVHARLAVASCGCEAARAPANPSRRARVFAPPQTTGWDVRARRC